jgi:hypothetical protein
MKKIVQLGALYIVGAIILAICGLVFAAMVLGIIATALGNLAIWPIIGAATIGQPITMPMAIGIAAVMAVIIYIFAGSVSDRSMDQMGAVMSLGCMASVIVVVLGFPLWMFLVYMNGGQLTGWAVIPCGVFTAGLIWTWMSSRKPG